MISKIKTSFRYEEIKLSVQYFNEENWSIDWAFSIIEFILSVDISTLYITFTYLFIFLSVFSIDWRVLNWRNFMLSFLLFTEAFRGGELTLIDKPSS